MPRRLDERGRDMRHEVSPTSCFLRFAHHPPRRGGQVSRRRGKPFVDDGALATVESCTAGSLAHLCRSRSLAMVSGGLARRPASLVAAITRDARNESRSITGASAAKTISVTSPCAQCFWKSCWRRRFLDSSRIAEMWGVPRGPPPSECVHADEYRQLPAEQRRF